MPDGERPLIQVIDEIVAQVEAKAAELDAARKAAE